MDSFWTDEQSSYAVPECYLDTLSVGTGHFFTCIFQRNQKTCCLTEVWVFEINIFDKQNIEYGNYEANYREKNHGSNPTNWVLSTMNNRNSRSQLVPRQKAGSDHFFDAEKMVLQDSDL